MALFNILISPLNAFPWVINGLMEAWVSTKRVQQFLQLEEVDWTYYYVGYNGAESGKGETIHALIVVPVLLHTCICRWLPEC